MSSTDKQGSSLDSFPTSPPLYPHFNRPSGFWPCVKSCLVGGSDKYRLVGLVGRLFANGPGDLGSIPDRVIPKTLKMLHDTSLLKTQQYKVRIKGKVEQSRKKSSALSYTSVL